MSVRVDLREISTLEVFTKSSELLAYTIRIVRNVKYFKTRYNKDLGDPCIHLARTAMYAIYNADKIRILDEQSYRKRTELQFLALECLGNLEAEITMNVFSFELDTSKAKIWSDLITILSSRIKLWMKSDIKTYEKLNKE